MSPIAEAAKSIMAARSGSMLNSFARVTTVPGITPAAPPVGAAQTTDIELHVCITAIAAAAAFVWRPPIGRRFSFSAERLLSILF